MVVTMKIDDTEPVFSIGIVAKKLGVSVSTVRMYEKEGLIIPYRTETGRRLYSFFDLKRISFIIELIKKEDIIDLRISYLRRNLR